MKIEIVNWQKFNNPRKDVKSTSWFRFQNDYFTDPDFCDLPHDQKWVFPYLCSIGSARMSAVFDVSESMACKILNIDIGAFEAATNHLLDRGIIKIAAARIRNAGDPRPRNARVTKSYRNGRTDGTDGTDGTNTTGETRRPSRAVPATASDLAVGTAWLEHGLSEMPWKLTDVSWTPERFAEAIAEVRAKTGITESGIAEVLDFIKRDDFWRKNACSPKGLLKKSDKNGERKIDNILVRIRTTASREIETLKKWAEG